MIEHIKNKVRSPAIELDNGSPARQNGEAWSSEQEGAIRLSVVIPTRDAAATLAAAIGALADRPGGPAEIIVIDGGSRDGTAAVARRNGARVIEAAPGRGGQLRAGAQAATGNWLLFLHADTVLDPGWADAVRAYVGRAGAHRRAAVFRFVLDSQARAARRLERVVAWRTRRLGLPYGDQGLLISRVLYEAIGGFRPLPLMEDVDIVRRIGRHRLDLLDVRAVTSAVRYRRSGYVRRPARNLVCLALYFLGLSPRLIARIYR